MAYAKYCTSIAKWGVLMEVIILYSVWSLVIFSLVLIPKDRLNEASVIFLFHQSLAWTLGLFAAEWNLIAYPVRELASVNRTSFTFEFFVFPVIGVFYILHYPEKKGIGARILYTAAITTVIIIPEIIFEKYTDLIKYIHWDWYISWLSVYGTFYLVRLFHHWFFKYNGA